MIFTALVSVDSIEEILLPLSEATSDTNPLPPVFLLSTKTLLPTAKLAGEDSTTLEVTVPSLVVSMMAEDAIPLFGVIAVFKRLAFDGTLS